MILEPLFKGYVFVRVPDSGKWAVTEIEGVVNYVYWLGKPAKVKEADIETIRKFLSEFNDVEIIDNHIVVDSKVVVKQGVFMNYCGIIVEVSGHTAKVLIDSMGVQLCARFDKSNLMPTV